MPKLEDAVIPEEKLGQFVIQVPTVSSKDFGEAVKGTFESRPEVEGIVVTEHGTPAGIIMRNAFFQKLSSLYGNSLYLRRPTSILMDTGFMKADAEDSISKVALQATSRNQDKLYDYIVVYKNNRYHGVISIRLFLAELSNRNEAQIKVLKQQQQKLLAAHEQELQLRTHLEYQSSAIRNLLDHAEQGFLWFGSDLVIRSEISYKCFEIFGKRIGNIRFTDLISDYFEPEKAMVFRMAFESYFQNNSPVTDAVYLMLLPTDCVIGGKSIHLEYKRIESDQNKAIMVVMNDISEKVALEQAMEHDRYEQRLLIKAFGCQPQIKRMIEEFRDLFSDGFKSFFVHGSDFGRDLDELFRCVHTYKGDFAQYGFGCASDQLHLFEDELMKLMNTPHEIGMPELQAIVERIKAEDILSHDLEVISNFLGSDYFDKSEIISIPKARLIDIDRELCSDKELSQGDFRQLIKGLLLKPVQSYLAQFEDYVEYLSSRVQKSKPIFLVEGDEVEVDGDLFDGFFQSLVHVFRNCMDHGIETDEERAEAGKELRGLIRCVVTAGDDPYFSICISDDGRGIDFTKLTQKGLEQGFLTAEQAKQASDKDLCNLIFADHITTKDEASSLSGRGVGMSAVRAACLKLGGTISVTTNPHRGTSFIMMLPYVPKPAFTIPSGERN